MRITRRDVTIFAVALLVRVLHLVSLRGSPPAEYLLIDSEFYDDLGRRLAAGDGFPEGVFFMNVLYGLFVGGVYSLFASPWFLWGVQVVLGSVTAVLTARLADRYVGSRGAWASGILWALYGPAVFYDAATLTPSLLTFLIVSSLVVAAGDRPRSWLLGLLLGLMILARANNVLLLPALALPWWSSPDRMRQWSVLLIAAALVVLPVTLRNLAVSGELVPVSANGGMAMWAGNHPGATGIYSEPSFLSNPVPDREAEDYRLEASRRAGEELTLAESSGFWVRETLRQWLDEPGATFRLFARKLWLFGSATESQTNLSLYFVRDFSPVLDVLRASFGWILPFAAVGWSFSVRATPLLWLPILASLLTCLAFYMSSEYRQPVVPCFLILAVMGALRLAALFRSRGSKGLRVGVIAVSVTLLFLSNYRDPFLARLQSRRVDYLNFGTLALMAEDLEVSESLLRKSVSIDPAWAVSRQKLAEALTQLGRRGEAAEELRRARELGGASAVPMAATLSQADSLFRAQRFEDAYTMFVAVAMTSGEERGLALNNAGLCAMRLERFAQADSLFRAAIEHDSLYVSPHVHRGRLALALGDSAQALAHGERALRLSSEDGRAQRLVQRARGVRPQVR